MLLVGYDLKILSKIKAKAHFLKNVLFYLILAIIKSHSTFLILPIGWHLYWEIKIWNYHYWLEF